MFGNTKTGEVTGVNYRGAFLMHDILLFKATKIASSLAQHRISRIFTVHNTLIKRRLVRISEDGRGLWVCFSIAGTEKRDLLLSFMDDSRRYQDTFRPCF